MGLPRILRPQDWFDDLSVNSESNVDDAWNWGKQQFGKTALGKVLGVGQPDPNANMAEIRQRLEEERRRQYAMRQANLEKTMAYFQPLNQELKNIYGVDMPGMSPFAPPPSTRNAYGTDTGMAGLFNRSKGVVNQGMDAFRGAVEKAKTEAARQGTLPASPFETRKRRADLTERRPRRSDPTTRKPGSR